jgi:hypothetical protein
MKRRNLGEGWSASDALQLNPEDGAISRIAAAFALPMETTSVPRFAEPGFGNTQVSATYKVNMEVTPDFPQVQPTYPGIAGQFLAGEPIYVGGGGTPLNVSVWQFRHEVQRSIVQDFNSGGRPVPYDHYAQDGSRDFTVTCANQLNTANFTEELIPCYASYNADIVNPTTTDSQSIFHTGEILANTNDFVGTPYAAHGIHEGIGFIPTATHNDKLYIWHDGGNWSGTANTYSNNNGVTQIAGGVTATTADGVASGCLMIRYGDGNVATMQPAFTAELWAYNEASPYRVATAAYKATAALNPVTDVNKPLIVFQIPYPDYYRIVISASDQAVAGVTNTMNFRISQLSASHLYRHLANPQLDIIWGAVKAHRGYGSALRIHNSTVGEYPGGEVVCWQGSLGTEWSVVIDGNGTPYDFINQKNKGVQESISMKKGSYTWLRPVSLQQANYFEDIEALTTAGQTSNLSGAPIPVSLNFPLRGRSWVCTCVKVPTTGSLGVPVQTFTYYMGYTGQWTTDAQYWTVADGDYTSTEWEEAMIMLQSMMQITSNEDHLARIGRILNSAGRFGGKMTERFRGWGQKLMSWAPHILKVVEAAAPLLI